MKKEKTNKTSRLKDISILLIILGLALVFRLYKIDSPLGDLFSGRQANTVAVARNFVKDGFDILHPHSDDLSNTLSNQENPNGYYMGEFPLYSAIIALLYKTAPFISLEVFGRATSIFFSLILITVIYYLLLKDAGRSAAVVGSLTFAIFPFFVFFSRVVLPEVTALSLCFISIFFLYLYITEKIRHRKVLFYLMSIIFFALGVLTKSTVIFYSIALGYLFFRKYHFRLLTQISFYLFFILSLLPALLWRYHASFFPEGIPVNEWLISQVITPSGKESIFFHITFFRKVFFENINNAILGGYLLFIFLFGVVNKNRKYFFYYLLITSLIYLLTFQSGNFQFEYYLIMILPPVAMFIGLGIESLKNSPKNFITPIALYPLVAVIFMFSWLFSYSIVKNYYHYSSELVEISKIVKYVTKPEDLIITDTAGDATLLYLSERRGSSSVDKDFSSYKKIGYKYFVTQNKEIIQNIKTQKILPERFLDTDKFAIFSL